MAVLVFLMAKIKQVPAGFKKCLAFTSLIAFVVSLIWNLVILIPFMYSYLAFAGTVQTMIIMALAYCGIYYYDNKKKTGGNNAHNP